MRISWRTFALTTPEGKPFSLSDHFETLPAAAGPHEVMVLARTGPKTPPLTLRLIILRKSPEATEAARAKLRKHDNPAAEEARPANPRHSRVPGPGHVAAGRALSGRRHLCRLPPATADRACLQAAEITPAYRPDSYPHPTSVAKLAAHPPRSCPLMRRRQPANAGIFPLRTSVMRPTCHLFGGCIKLPL